MNIRQFAVEETETLHLRSANGELLFADGDPNKPMTVVLYGPGSDTFNRAKDAQYKRYNQFRKRKGDKAVMSFDELNAEGVAFLVDVTKGFNNVEYDDLRGADLARAVYADKSIGFIADQVTDFTKDWANFTKGSEKS